MIKAVRETEKKPKELTPEEQVTELKKEVQDLKLVLDDIILNGGAV